MRINGSKRARKHPPEMTRDEFERATRRYDKGMDPSKARPLNQAGNTLWAKAKRGRGRPRVGKGAQYVPVSMERGLFDRLNAFAEASGTTRSAVIAEALERLLASTATRIKRPA